MCFPFFEKVSHHGTQWNREFTIARNGSGVYSLPAGSIVSDGDTGTASQHNTPLQDLETDMNTARPIVAGGTGATTAEDARTNLGLSLPLAVASGGTGGETAAEALANLGIGVKIVAAGIVTGGATPTVHESYNVASVTQSSTGVHNITFSTAEADANYITLCNVLSASTVTSNVSYQGTVYTQIATRASGVLTDTLFMFVVIRIQ